MIPKYHRRITAHALEEQVSPLALETITLANLGQDAIRYQFGHAHFHYDDSSFKAGDAYLDEMRRAVHQSLNQIESIPAWQAFGRLLHAVQDFYAHSNYITLWREHYPEATPDQTPPLFAEALNDPRLHSGRLYYPFEVLSFVPALRGLVLPWLPHDAHAWMHKDDPSRPDFDFAYAAAVKRTLLEFQIIIQALPAAQTSLFTDRG